MRPVATVAEMRAADTAALHEVSEETLVDRAGTAVAAACLDLVGGAYGRRVLVVAGRGNNGADGRVVAHRLRRRGALVEVADALAPTHVAPGAVDLVVDAAFGTGFRGTYEGPKVPAGVPVVAVDIPSGVDGDTGEACGAPLRADVTVTFAALKPGLLLGDGPLLSGRVQVADIGLAVGATGVRLLEDADVATLLPPRARDAHKWDAAVAVVAGSPGMTGAAALCARAAYRSGAGMVRLGVPGLGAAAAAPSEAVSLELPAQRWADPLLDVVTRCRALVVGPGLGRAPATAAEVRDLVARATVPVVVDADGLFALGSAQECAAVVAGSRTGRPVVLTPHAGEFERMAGVAPGADPIGAARDLATRTGAVVLLKGPTTVVAGPDAAVLLAAAGDARLATAGTGDVLSGMIGAFLARGVPAAPAAALAAHVHGRAGALGPARGLMAGDLADLVARWLSDPAATSSTTAVAGVPARQVLAEQRR